MAELLKLLNDPVYAGLASAIAAFVLSVLARRGVNVPLISELLSYFIGRKPAPFPPPPLPSPAPTAAAAIDPALVNAIAEALKQQKPTG